MGAGQEGAHFGRSSQVKEAKPARSSLPSQFKKLSIRVQEAGTAEADSCLVDGILEEKLQPMASFALDEKPEMRRNVSVSESYEEGTPGHAFPEEASSSTHACRVEGGNLGQRELQTGHGRGEACMPREVLPCQIGEWTVAGPCCEGYTEGTCEHTLHGQGLR